MIGNNNQTVNRISAEAELTLLFELKGLFATKVNATLAALYRVAEDLDFRAVNDGPTHFIRVVNGSDKLETHRSKVSRYLNDRVSYDEVKKRVEKMKKHILRYHPEYTQLLGVD